MTPPRKIVKLIPFGDYQTSVDCQKMFCKSPAVWRVNGKALCYRHKQKATK